MSHRKEPREVGGIYPSQQYVVVEQKKRVELTPEQREAGETWVFPSAPERPYVVGEKPTSTTVLKPPETYETWLPIADPERRYVVGTHKPRITDVTLIKAPPSVRAEIRQRAYQEQMETYQTKIQASKAFWLGIQTSLFGVSTKLYEVELRLREQTIIQKQRAAGYEFIGKKGEELFFVPKQDKGIAETIMGWQLPSLGLGRALIPEPIKTIEGKKRPLGLIAGQIATFESLGYGVARLFGVKTPRPPPTFTSGLIGKGIGAVTGVPSYELEKTMEYGPEYAAATIIGDILLSAAIGTAVEKVVMKPIVRPKAEAWLTKQYVKKGLLAWKGWKEKVVMKVTGARPYLAYGEVSIPTAEVWGLKGAEAIPKGLPYTDIGWELTIAPRTGGVMISKVPTTTLTKGVLPVFFGLGTELIEFIPKKSLSYVGGKEARTFKYERIRDVGGFEKTPWRVGWESKFGFEKARMPILKELMKQQKLLPFVTQTQLTRMGIFPYIPKVIAVTGKKGISHFLLGFGLTTITKARPPTDVRQISPITLPTLRKQREILFPKMWLPTLAYTREKFRSLTIERRKAKERERLIPIVKSSPFQIPESELKLPILEVPKQIPKQVPATPQIVTQIPQIPTPTVTIPTVPTPIMPRFRLPGRRVAPRRMRGLFGRWFEREHPIKTPKEMWRTFSLAPRKTRKRKAKKRKKRREVFSWF